jgi:cob(I)alamin adenosyltransferase
MIASAISRLLIFTGDGKGKTTASLGMAVRAIGHGMRVKIIQFIKADDTTGEIAFARNVEQLEIVQTGRGFVPKKGHKNFDKHVAAALQGVDLAREALMSADYSLVILDEICSTVQLGLLEEHAVLDLLSHAEHEKIVVLTGRNATSAMIAVADTVTEMRCIKHGYEIGKKAQPGVEN